MTEFEQQIILAIAALREGEVVTYGEIAERAGNAKAPRAVGRVLSSSDRDLPWWRVLRSDGTLLKSHLKTQTELLSEEGVVVRRGKVISAPYGRWSK